MRSGADYYRMLVHGPARLAACDVKPREAALDLGCGEGHFARELARRGAQVNGIDLSDRLLAYARTAEASAPLGIRYIEASASKLEDVVAAGTFDLVASCMALQDMSDPAACLLGVTRAPC